MVTMDNQKTGNFTVPWARDHSIRHSAIVNTEKDKSEVPEPFPSEGDVYLKQKRSVLQKMNATAKQEYYALKQHSLKRDLHEAQLLLSKVKDTAYAEANKVPIARYEKLNEGLLWNTRAHHAKSASLITPEGNYTPSSHESSGGSVVQLPLLERQVGIDTGLMSTNSISSSISPPRKRSRVSFPTPQTFVETDSLTPPVSFVFDGRPGVVSKLSNKFFVVEKGDESSAPSIGDIEGAREDNGFWYLYTKKSPTTYLEFEFTILAAVNFQKIRDYAYKYEVWGLLFEKFKQKHSKV